MPFYGYTVIAGIIIDDVGWRWVKRNFSWGGGMPKNGPLFNKKGPPNVDGQKVGHFLITVQKSFKLIFNQLWA